MSSPFLIAEGSDIAFEMIWLLVMVLIGIGSLIKGIVQKMNREKRGAGGKATPASPPISERVRSEIRKYLGELDEPARPERSEPAQREPAAPESRPSPAPSPRLAPRPPAPVPVPLQAPPPPPPPSPVPARRVRRPKKRRMDRGASPAAARATDRDPVLRTGNREDLRRAILAREILGPPVALRRRAGTSRLSRR